MKPEYLGHSSIQITLDFYSHVPDGMRDEAAEQVAALIIGSPARPIAVPPD